MLNLAQRLIVGCVALFGLTLVLVMPTHRALAAAGQATLGYLFVLAALLIAAATMYSCAVAHSRAGAGREEDRPGQSGTPRRVEQPRRLWRDRQRAEPASRCGCANCATPRPDAGRWSFSSPTPCCNRSLSRSS